MHKKQLIVVAVALALAACSPKVDTRGYVRQDEWKGQVTPGTSTKDDVLARFGSPSSRSSFGSETWYYISARKETVAFLRPEVAEQDVTRVEFDANGVVTKVESYDKSSGKDVDMVSRTTPTEGHSLGFLEQILGNIGRFNSGSKDTVAPGRKGR